MPLQAIITRTPTSDTRKLWITYPCTLVAHSDLRVTLSLCNIGWPKQSYTFFQCNYIRVWTVPLCFVKCRSSFLLLFERYLWSAKLNTIDWLLSCKSMKPSNCICSDLYAVSLKIISQNYRILWSCLNYINYTRVSRLAIGQVLIITH